MNEVNFMLGNVFSIRELIEANIIDHSKYKNSPDWFLDFKVTKEMLQDIKAFHNLDLNDLLEIWRSGPDLSKNDFCIKGLKISVKNKDFLSFYIEYPQSKKFKAIHGDDLMDYENIDEIREYLEGFYAEYTN